MSNAGDGILGFFGSLLEQSPLTRPFMQAGRVGLMSARQGQATPEGGGGDWGTSFLGVSPNFGYDQAPAPMDLGTANLGLLHMMDQEQHKKRMQQMGMLGMGPIA